MLDKKLIEKIKKLSPQAKLILAEVIFDSQLEKDNYGQYVVYTGLVTGTNGRVRKMCAADIF